MLDKPGVFGNHTDRARRAGFLLQNPLIALEGKAGPKGLCSKEGTDSLCWVCVGVLEVRLVLV